MCRAAEEFNAKRRVRFDDRERRVAEAPADRLAPALVRLGESYEAFALRSAVISGISGRSLRLVQGKGESLLEM